MNDGTFDPTLKRPHKGPIADLPEGMEVGEYRVLRKIGEGGMGAVYAAVHPVIGKRVAIKVLAPHIANHPELVRRFVDEARAVNKIGHPNIVDIFSFGWLPDQRHYFAMEYLEGQTLSDRMKAGPFSVVEARRLLGQICGALEAAHQVGIIHRDLKPENIWIAQPKHGDSYAKLLDFGIAKLLGDADSAPHTQTGAIMGTPAYMAPEQCRGVGVEARTDLYSLGVILYEMFTGRTPFQGSFVELITKHLSDAPEAPSHFGQIPPALERLIMSCLEKEPARRPGSAASLARELEAALVAVPAAAAQTAAAPTGVAAGAGDTLSPLPGKTSPGATMLPARTRAPLVWFGGAGAVALAVVIFLVLARQPAQPEPGPVALADSASQPAAPAAAVTGHVRVVAQNASNARFFIDDRLVASGAREADLPSVTPDRPHLLRVESDGLTPAERPFTVAAGGVVEIQLTLGAAPIMAPAAPAGAAPPSPSTSAARPKGSPAAPPKPTSRPAHHRDGLVGDDIFDKK